MGIGMLRNWTWIINERGYANIVELPRSSGLDQPLLSTTTPALTLTNTHGPDTLHRTATAHDVVFGLVYALPSADETSLDGYEGVPYAYTKEMHHICYWPAKSEKLEIELQHDQIDIASATSLEALVYVDRERIQTSTPRAEYVLRMERGVKEAAEKGVPGRWLRDIICARAGLDTDLSH